MNAYGQPPQYGYGMPPQNGAVRGSAGLAKGALAFLGIRILMSLVNVITGPIIIRSIMKSGGRADGIQTFFAVQRGVMGLVVFIAALLFMLFIRSEIVALRASGIATKYTPGWAIGWWFVPFANFVMPVLVVLDVWKQRLPRAGGALPVLWWVAYCVSMLSSNVPLPVPYLGLVIALAAYGLWATITFMLMSAPATAPYAQPQGYYAPQPSYPPPVQAPYGYNQPPPY